MIKFALGFAAGLVFVANIPNINKALEKQIARLELKRDLLMHDNPDLQ